MCIAVIRAEYGRKCPVPFQSISPAEAVRRGLARHWVAMPPDGPAMPSYRSDTGHHNGCTSRCIGFSGIGSPSHTERILHLMPMTLPSSRQDIGGTCRSNEGTASNGSWLASQCAWNRHAIQLIADRPSVWSNICSQTFAAGLDLLGNALATRM